MLKRRPPLTLSEEQILKLNAVQSSPMESRAAIVRARILLRCHAGERVGSIARQEGVSRPTVYLCIQKAIALGIEGALRDLSRSGRPSRVSDGDRTWVKELAGSTPLKHGHEAEKWTVRALARHVQMHASKTGHDALGQACTNTVRRVLKDSSPGRQVSDRRWGARKAAVSERRSIQILGLSSTIRIFEEHDEESPRSQGIPAERRDHVRGEGLRGQITADLSPRSMPHSVPCPDGDLRQVDSVMLLAGIDLVDGRVLALVRDRNNSQNFIEFLKTVHDQYPLDARIHIILQRHSTPISRHTMQWLKEHPFRFEFIFTPEDTAWLNTVETLFVRTIRFQLRSVRAHSLEDVIERLYKYLQALNALPAATRWGSPKEIPPV